MPLGLATPNLGLITNIIACPGGDFCSLANAVSIPVAAAIQHKFDDLDFQLFVVAYDELLCPGSGPSRPFCLSDLNGDNVVDDLDFQVFVVQYDRLLCP